MKEIKVFSLDMKPEKKREYALAFMMADEGWKPDEEAILNCISTLEKIAEAADDGCIYMGPEESPA